MMTGNCWELSCCDRCVIPEWWPLHAPSPHLGVVIMSHNISQPREPTEFALRCLTSNRSEKNTPIFHSKTTIMSWRSLLSILSEVSNSQNKTMKGQSFGIEKYCGLWVLLTGFEPWPVFFLVVWPGASYPPAAGLRFHVCTAGKTGAPTSKIVLRINI